MRGAGAEGAAGQGRRPEAPGSQRHTGPGWAFTCSNSLGQHHSPGRGPARIPLSRVQKLRPREGRSWLRVAQERMAEPPGCQAVLRPTPRACHLTSKEKIVQEGASSFPVLEFGRIRC